MTEADIVDGVALRLLSEEELEAELREHLIAANKRLAEFARRGLVVETFKNGALDFTSPDHAPYAQIHASRPYPYRKPS